MDTDGEGIPNSLDPDDDNDGLADVYETDTGTYVSPTDTGTDPLDDDSDDDGHARSSQTAARPTATRSRLATPASVAT
jgi:hypothetical protein